MRAVLDGGGGRDEMRGGFGFETFLDGDLDGAIGKDASGSDVIDGGREATPSAPSIEPGRCSSMARRFRLVCLSYGR